MKYGIEVGQIWIAADGSKGGHLVVDNTTYAYCDDVVVYSFTPLGLEAYTRKIDAWKLACVRYYLPLELPEWVPETVRLKAQTTSSTPDPTYA